MSFTPPSSAVRQPTESSALDSNARKTHDIAYKGPYDDLKTAADSISVGTLVEQGSYALEWKLERAPGCGILSITCSPTNPNSSSSASSSQCIDDLWELISLRNDVSVLQFCGDSNVNPNRARIEAWMKEPDGELASQFKFRNSAGTEVELSSADKMVARKIAQGRDTVVRFYAAVVRTRTYDGPPPQCLENLNKIDTPPYAVGTRAPDGISTAISAREWLKMQDDAKGQPDKTWKRIESWWGILITESTGSHPWDADFYGANPWTVPLSG